MNQTSKIWKNHFGQEPKITIKFDDAKLIAKIIENRIIRGNYNNINDLKRHMDILSCIEAQIYMTEDMLKTILE